MSDTETSVLLYWETKNKNGLCFKLLIQKKNEDFSVTFVSPLENDLSQVPNPPSENPIPKKKMFEPLRSCTGHITSLIQRLLYPILSKNVTFNSNTYP